MPEPGWIPPNNPSGPPDDCMRMAFSCVTGIHPRRLRYIAPSDCTDHQFWKQWRVLAIQKGYQLKRLFNVEGEPLDGLASGPWPVKDGELWIAGVPSFIEYNGTHAVVMRGQQLHYDPCEVPRKRRPTRIESGWRVIVDG